MIRLVIISDTHGKHSQIKHALGDIPEGDILIHAGDISNVGEEYDVRRFLSWFYEQSHHTKIFIAGNHDFLFENEKLMSTEMIEEFQKKSDIRYLEDTSTEVEGLNFWGSPVTPPFFNWAFMRKDVKIVKHWEYIADDTDVLITHGPPKDILDYSRYGNENCGCPYLRMRVLKIKPLVHIFGHIHGEYGTHVENDTLFINASTLNERYMVRNKPIVVDVDPINKTATLVK